MAAGTGNQDKKTTAATPGKARRVLGFFTPDLGTGPTQVRETHGIFLQILASLFFSVGILPRDHAYMQPGAKFSIGELFATTLARIDWKDKRQLPQTIFFCAVWGLLVSTVLYVVTAVLLFVAMPSHAYAADTTTGTTASSGMFSVPDDDLAQQFLHNLVEGKPIQDIRAQGDGMNQSLTETGPLQTAFRAMLKYYSSVILIIASFMVLYHIIMLLVNSAWSGKPLEGANQIWGPLRLAIAIGLLVPLSGGLNSGQYMVLKAAEVGSAAGTKMWNLFTDSLSSNLDQVQVEADSKTRDEFLKMILIHACHYDVSSHTDEPGKTIYKTTTKLTDISNAVNMADGDPAKVIKFSDSLGFVQCGKITYPSSQIASTSGLFATDYTGATALEKLSSDIKKVTRTAAEKLDASAEKLAIRLVNYQFSYDEEQPVGPIASEKAKFPTVSTDSSVTPILQEIRNALNTYYDDVNNGVKTAVQQSNSWDFIKNKSWALAGAYYMQISGYQSTIYSAVKTPPLAELGPIFGRQVSSGGLLETLKSFGTTLLSKGGNMYATPEENYFVKNLDGTPLSYMGRVKQALFEDPSTSGISGEISQAQADGQEIGGLLAPLRVGVKAIYGTLSTIFGLDKSYFVNIFKEGVSDPFAAFVNAGHYILNAGLAAFMTGLSTLLYAQAQGSIPVFGGGAVSTVALAGWVMSLSIYMLSIGVLLCFVLPLVPVIKFMGGVITWMLAIMEAVIGMPLFALAHLTPGGNGLLDPARQGYVMLFHIAIRPMLIVFGMVVAIIIITPAIFLLNAMFIPAINAAWQPDDGGLVLALVTLGLWTYFAYGIVQKVFAFQDYLSHGAMRWLGGSSYQFERYKGEGNAYAATAVFSKVTDMANSAIGSRQKGALAAIGETEEANESDGRNLGKLKPKTAAGKRALAARLQAYNREQSSLRPYGLDDKTQDAANEENKLRTNAGYISGPIVSALNDRGDYQSEDGPGRPPGGPENDGGGGSGGSPKFGPIGGGGGGLTEGGSMITAVDRDGKATPRATVGPRGPETNAFGSNYTMGLGNRPEGTISVKPGETPAEISQHFEKLGLQKTAGVQDVNTAFMQKAQEQQDKLNSLPAGSADYMKAESELKELGKANDSLVNRMGGNSSLLADSQKANLRVTPPPGLEGARVIDMPDAPGVDGDKWKTVQYKDGSIGYEPAAKMAQVTGSGVDSNPGGTPPVNPPTTTGLNLARGTEADAAKGPTIRRGSSFLGVAALGAGALASGGGIGGRAQAAPIVPTTISTSVGGQSTTATVIPNAPAPTPNAASSVGSSSGGFGGTATVSRSAAEQVAGISFTNNAGLGSTTNADSGVYASGSFGGGQSSLADGGSGGFGGAQGGGASVSIGGASEGGSGSYQTIGSGETQSGFGGNNNAGEVTGSPDVPFQGSLTVDSASVGGGYIDNAQVPQSFAASDTASPAMLGAVEPVMQNSQSVTQAVEALAPAQFSAPPVDNGFVTTSLPQAPVAQADGGVTYTQPQTFTPSQTQGAFAPTPASAPSVTIQQAQSATPPQAPASPLAATPTGSQERPQVRVDIDRSTGVPVATATITPPTASEQAPAAAPPVAELPRNVAGVDLNLPSSATSFTERLAEIEAAGGDDPTKPKGRKGKKGKQGLGSA